MNGVCTSGNSRTSIGQAVRLLVAISPFDFFGLLLDIGHFIAFSSSLGISIVFLKSCIDSRCYKEVLNSFWVEPILLIFRRLLDNFPFPEMRQG